jgi:hypothetical protein
VKRTQPLQPLALDPQGILRFQENKVVRFLLEEASKGRQCDLNKIACYDFPQEDQEQFAQLIGYSLSGFSELSYVSDETFYRAEKSYYGVDE